MFHLATALGINLPPTRFKKTSSVEKPTRCASKMEQMVEKVSLNSKKVEDDAGYKEGLSTSDTAFGKFGSFSMYRARRNLVNFRIAIECLSAGANNALSCAYVTFLGGDGDYVKGVVCLAKGLRKVKAAYPLVVAVLHDVPEEHRNLLVNQGCLLREIDPVYPPVGNKKSPFIRPYFALNYCKLRLWEFVEYDKMVYLDADIQVFDNIDNLFDLPSGCLYAVMDCLCEMRGQPCADKVQWPEDLGNEPPFYFNGGMFVFEPNLDTYNNLLSTLKVTPPTQFAEQDFLNFFFEIIEAYPSDLQLVGGYALAPPGVC
ncbi:hypothetical protein DH2020_026830 [Rehmannia glutinosa]|uniref:Hexosyltransferase n=1 Tax=Rehmannia glutinosa TaxID=99300 RepID=A0ABR0VVZ5_REHGL